MQSRIPVLVAIAPLIAAFFAISSASRAAQSGEDNAGGGDDADSARDEAKLYFAAGSEAYSKREYKTAVDQFRKAFELVQAPEILFNIGRCHEELGRKEEAIHHYEMYLRFYPTAEDAEGVKQRIRVLKAGETKPQEEENEESSRDEVGLYDDAKSDTGQGTGPRLGAAVGFRVPVTGEWALRTVVPIEIDFHYPLLDWLYVMGAATVGVPVYGDAQILPADITSLFGITVGASAVFYSKGRVDLEGSLGVMLTSVAREHWDRVTWLDFPAGFNVIVKIYKGWRATAAAIVDFGPVFNVLKDEANTGDPWWIKDPNPTFDLGMRFGLEYAFP